MKRNLRELNNVKRLNIINCTIAVSVFEYNCCNYMISILYNVY